MTDATSEPTWYACEHDGCVRTFPTKHGVAMHRRRAHGVRGASPSARSRASHLEVVGWRDEKATARRRRGSFQQVDGMVVLVDGDGGVWIAERMR